MQQVCYFCFCGDVVNLTLSAFMSVSILSNIVRNFGLLFCMRLLDASDMLSASIRISISASLS